jgi:hypothetical protein
MNRLAVLAAVLCVIAAATQAVACDMGAIETWVAAACQSNDCYTKTITENSAGRCDSSNCAELYSNVRSELSRRLTAK